MKDMVEKYKKITKDEFRLARKVSLQPMCCANCGSDAVLVITCVYVGDAKSPDFIYFVRCPECGMSGSEESRPDDARDSWLTIEYHSEYDRDENDCNESETRYRDSFNNEEDHDHYGGDDV